MPELKPIPLTPMSLPDLVGRLEELVKFALECEGKELGEKVSFVDIYKELMDIRKSINTLDEAQQQTLSIIESASKEDTPKEPPLTKEEEKTLGKIQHLQEVCEGAKERIHAAIQEQPEIEAQLKEEVKASTSSKKKKVVRRKGKFRRVGGKEGWIPT